MTSAPSASPDPNTFPPWLRHLFADSVYNGPSLRQTEAAELRVKLEGAGKIGERYVGIVGVRDPYTIANIDLVTAWARQQVTERFGDSGYELHFSIYGRNAILGDREPMKAAPAHELGER